MGDLRDWSPEPNMNGRDSSAAAAVDAAAIIGAEYWLKAEEATLEIIAQVQPTVVSEERRKAVIDYVQRLIMNYLGCQVYPFGSVPLKTYLPDGDIDLTAFGGFNVEEALANDVCAVLEREDQNRGAEFIVKDAQLIRAEVKLVKCLVQNIVVDISFNQLGGLCTLCFLEQVDRLIGKDHLFKRSIILIKAWCYYESRILGAHHGLISTYALETLVLYIFHLFHTTLNGPLAVLYKFLEYFSKFDWDNYCISLNGPVRISSLPDVVVEKPENDGGDLLLSSEFLKDCVEQFSVPARGFETNSRTFPPKFLNIVDPLKENNNLGRSVNKGNFYRIRSAFTYGARKLGRILSQPEENLAAELRRFFSNTLDRHGSEQRPDVQDPVPMSRHNGFSPMSVVSGAEFYQEDQCIYESESTISSGTTENHKSEHEGSMHVGGNVESSNSKIANVSHGCVDGNAISERRLSGDAKDLATSKIQSLKISDDVVQSSTGEDSNTPHLYSTRSPRNGEVIKSDIELKQSINSGLSENKVASECSIANGKLTGPSDHDDQEGKHLTVSVSHDVQSPVGSKCPPFLMNMAPLSEDANYGYSCHQASPGTCVTPETLNSVSDLSGDYDSHLISLHHGRWCFEHALNASYSPMSPPMVPTFHNKNSWDLIPRSLSFRRNVIPHMNTNGVVPRPIYYPINPPILPGASFAMDEMPKPRGTGTYFPNANHYRDRPSSGRGRNQVRSPRNNGRLLQSPEVNFAERSFREPAPGQFQVHQNNGKSGLSDPCQSDSPERRGHPDVDSPMHQPDNKVVESGSPGHPPVRSTSPDSSQQPDMDSIAEQDASTTQSSPTKSQTPNPLMNSDQEDRIAVQYRMKEEDFPPLSI